MPTPSSASASVVAQWILAVVAVLFFLRAAQALLIPIVLAVLISYALAPVVSWMERHGIPRLAGAGLVLLSIVGALGAGAYALKDDARALVNTLPEAMDRSRETLISQLGPGGKAVQEAAAGTLANGAAPDGGTNDQVIETAGDTAAGSLIQSGVGQAFSLAGHFVVVFFLSYFLLASGHRVRNRLLEIAGPDPDRQRTTSAIINEIDMQIQRYLLVLLLTALIVGTVTWLVLAWMGVENAAIWGILAGVFNSIPYFGPLIVSGGLFVVGMLQGGLTEALQMSAVAIVITALEGWLLTPALMGKAERMSALAVFVGLMLWTWMWGAWGTVLAVPMLVVLKSVADHVQRLRAIGRLMAP